MKKIFSVIILLIGMFSLPSSTNSQSLEDGGGVTCYATYSSCSWFRCIDIYRCIPHQPCESVSAKYDYMDSSTCP